MHALEKKTVALGIRIRKKLLGLSILISPYYLPKNIAYLCVTNKLILVVTIENARQRNLKTD
jgi:hypothetical protein